MFFIPYLTPLGFNSEKLKEIATNCDSNTWKQITDCQEKHNEYLISLKQIESFIDHIDKLGISDFIIHEFDAFQDVKKVENPNTQGQKALNQIIDFYMTRRNELSEKCVTAISSKLQEFQNAEGISNDLKKRIDSAAEQEKSNDKLKAFEEINTEIKSYKELLSLLSTLNTNSNKIARTINAQFEGIDEHTKKNIISFADSQSKDKIRKIMNNIRTVNSKNDSSGFLTRIIDILIALVSGLNKKNTSSLKVKFEERILNEKNKEYGTNHSFTFLILA